MAFSRACLSIYATIYRLFSFGFCQNLRFYTGYAVQFSTRSDPFSEVFLRDLLSEVDMHAYWAITYVYTVVLVSIFAPKS
jgi:hypothetical protein